MKRPRIGIFKLASCDGCQLSILNLSQDFLKIAELFRIDYFREATDRALTGHFDLSIIEGSVSNPEQLEKLIDLRERSRNLITIGACATSGGLQALRNWSPPDSFKNAVYPEPSWVDILSTSTPVSDHVYVDYELWGCPVDSSALSEVLASFLMGKKPCLPQYSLCMECKSKGIPCVLVAQGEPCLGPVTRAGCGVLCPSFSRACYGCFGPREDANIESLMKQFEKLGFTQKDRMSFLDRMNTCSYRRVQVEKKD